MKRWAADVYQTEAFNSLLPEALHPGGLAMTRRMVEVSGVNRHSTILDIACGKGATAMLVGREVGSRVVGIDLSSRMITLAQQQSRSEALDNVEFGIADAGRLPFVEASFDTIFSECSFSVLPDKKTGAAEMSRVLQAGGRLILTDVTLKKPPKPGDELDAGSSYPLIPSLAGALTIPGYLDIFAKTGFENLGVEDHSATLKTVAYRAGMQFGGWDGFFQRLLTELPLDAEAQQIAKTRACQTLAAPGKFGYALMMFSKK